MSESSNKKDDTKKSTLSLSRAGKLDVNQRQRADDVQQSFSHGRKHAV